MVAWQFAPSQYGRYNKIRSMGFQNKDNSDSYVYHWLSIFVYCLLNQFCLAFGFLYLWLHSIKNSTFYIGSVGCSQQKIMLLCISIIEKIHHQYGIWNYCWFEFDYRRE